MLRGHWYRKKRWQLCQFIEALGWGALDTCASVDSSLTVCSSEGIGKALGTHVWKIPDLC